MSEQVTRMKAWLHWKRLEIERWKLQPPASLDVVDNLVLFADDIEFLLEENARLKERNDELYGELIGQEHRLGTKYESEIIKLRDLLGRARELFHFCDGDNGAIHDIIGEIDAVLGEAK